jgi:hypothetical protein
MIEPLAGVFVDQLQRVIHVIGNVLAVGFKKITDVIRQGVHSMARDHPLRAVAPTVCFAGKHPGTQGQRAKKRRDPAELLWMPDLHAFSFQARGAGFKVLRWRL